MDLVHSSEQLIEKTAEYMRTALVDAEPGHDWWHTTRVWKIAKEISHFEGGESVVVELASLLHDIADYKFHGGDESVGPRKAKEWLISCGADPLLAERVSEIIASMNFKGAQASEAISLEHAIVQDADRLDALGAIGIARCFSYAGHFGRELYNPEIMPQLFLSKEEYRNSKSTALNHFFEKLLLLKDQMLTETGRILASEKHEFMLEYLQRFLVEAQADHLQPFLERVVNKN